MFYRKRIFIGVCLLLLLPVLALAADFAVVRGGTLNLRAYPSMDAASIGQYGTGTWVRVTGSATHGFYPVVTMTGRSGYMSSGYLNFGSGSTIGKATVTTRNGGRVNVRSGPSSSYRSITTVATGTRVNVLVKGSGWYKIRVNGITGYMTTTYLTNGSGGGGDEGYGQTGTAYVRNPGAGQVLNLREYPSTDARSIGQYYTGKKVTVLTNNGTWCRVRVDGRYGYMMTRYLRFHDTDPYYGSGNHYGDDDDDDDDDNTPRPHHRNTATPKPTSTPKPETSSTPEPGKTASLVSYEGGPSSITVFNDSACTQSKASYSPGTSVMILQYGKKVTLILVDGGTAYVPTTYLNY